MPIEDMADRLFPVGEKETMRETRSRVKKLAEGSIAVPLAKRSESDWENIQDYLSHFGAPNRAWAVERQNLESWRKRRATERES